MENAWACKLVLRVIDLWRIELWIKVVRPPGIGYVSWLFGLKLC